MMMTTITSDLIQETTIERMIVYNGCLQFYEENLYNFVKYCENFIRNTNNCIKNIYGMWNRVLIPFMVPFFAA